MKYLISAFLIAFTCMQALRLQSQSPQDTPSGTPKEHSMVGCLQKGGDAGSFRLTNVEKGPATVEIAESVAKLEPHVGHKMEITGTGIKGKDPQAHTMKVTSVKMLAAGCSSSAASAQPSAAHALFTPSDVKWGAGPPTLPKGAQVALLEGNLSESGPFTMRVKFPANYKIAPHWHPAIEHLTVLSGTFNVGMGDNWDETKGKALSAGSFAVMQPKTNHFAWTTQQETIVQVHGTGPWGITYVNASDDPSKK
jgi:hypothetical protein